MALSLMRFQEYYESPKYVGKFFTVKEYKKWYRTSFGKGRFTYGTDWAGFNIPGPMFVPFYIGLFDPLTNKEKKVLRKLQDIDLNNSCIIATSSDIKHEALEHELAHSLYFTNTQYKNQVKRILNTLSRKDLKIIYSYLGKNHYAPAVFEDEAHAYLMCDMPFLKYQGLKLNKKHYKTSEQLKKLFKKFNK